MSKQRKQRTVARALADIDACGPAKRWAEQCGTDWRRAWYACHALSWLEWLATRALAGGLEGLLSDDLYYGLSNAASREGTYDKRAHEYWHKPTADEYRKAVPWRTVRAALVRRGLIEKRGKR